MYDGATSATSTMPPFYTNNAVGDATIMILRKNLFIWKQCLTGEHEDHVDRLLFDILNVFQSLTQYA